MRNKVVDTFIELVQIDSPSGEEAHVRDFLIKKLLELGIESSVDKAGNLVAIVPGEGLPLLLCAHMDTVEPGRNIEPVVNNGVIKSLRDTILGADNKVALAAILTALQSTSNTNRRALEIVFSVREETDGGINQFDFKKLKSKTGLIADSSFPVGTIIIGSPWIEELKIKILGKASHAGIPEKGVNAFKIAANSLSILNLGRIDELTTCNIGLMKGGQATNTIPDNLLLEGEVRSFSKNKLDYQVALMKTVLVEETKKLNGEIDFENYTYCPGYLMDKKDLIEISTAIKKSGLKVNYTKTFGGSDANTFNHKGIKVVNIGDGTKNSHTVNEEVTTRSLVNLTKVIENYISI